MNLFRAQIQHLAHQVYSEKPKFSREIYFDATANPHNYLLLDLKQTTTKNCRFPTFIFSSNQYKYIYVLKKEIKGHLILETVLV